MRLILSLLLAVSYLCANVGTIVDVVGNSTLTRATKQIKVVPKLELKKHDLIKTGRDAKVKIFFKDNTAVSLGKNTTFEIDSYLFTEKKDSNIKFKVLKGFFKTVTGKIGKVAPNRFKLQTKTATIGIRGTVFAAEVGTKADVVICTDGAVVLFTPSGEVELPAGNLSEIKKGVKPKPKRYTQAQKEALVKNAGWHGSMSLKELIAYIKKNFKEPLRSQLLATLQNILDKDSDERKKYMPKSKVQNADDVGFVDEITINDREFDSLAQREIEFYPEDLQDGSVVIKGLLESEDRSVDVKDLYVEITVDGGDNWTRAKGHGEWEWSFKPELQKSYEFSFRVVKESASQEFKLAQIEVGMVAFETKKVSLDVDANGFTPKVITTEPIVFKFIKFTPKEMTTEPIVFKFKQFTPKEITSEPIVFKFKQFTPKEIISEPIVFKFKKFTPKEITTEPIVFKFKKFTPKTITTEPIVFKFIKFTPKEMTTEPIVFKFKKFTPKTITTEPIVFKFIKFTPKEMTTEPIVFKFKKFTPKTITTEPIVFKFIKFTPKEITSEPIVFKFKKFTPKEITSEPIVFKFKQFTPKTITTEPIVFKYKKPTLKIIHKVYR